MQLRRQPREQPSRTARYSRDARASFAVEEIVACGAAHFLKHVGPNDHAAGAAFFVAHFGERDPIVLSHDALVVIEKVFGNISEVARVRP